MLNIILCSVLLGGVNFVVDRSDASMLLWREDIPLLKAPVVITVTDFDESSAQQFSHDMQMAIASGEPIIPIVIDSYGGSIYSFLRMADTMKAAKVPIATICLGKCMSAGAMLLALGTEGLRFSAPNATILLHDASTGMSGKLSDIRNETAEIERLNKLIFTMIARNVGKPDSYFTDILDKKGHIDWFLSPEEAKKHNLVNQVKLPKIKIKIRTQMVFE